MEVIYLKFIYLAIEASGSLTQLNNKTLNQVSELRNLGVDAKIALIVDRMPEKRYEFIDYYILEDLNGPIRFNIVKRLYRQYRLFILLKEIFISIENQSVLYLRYLRIPWFGYACSILKKRGFKIVAEHNAIENNESIGLRIWDTVYGPAFRKQVDGIVCVTNAITEYEIKRSNYLLKPHVTIGNGVAVSSLRIHSPPTFFGDQLNLIFVGFVTYKHGVDRLLRGLGNYQGKIKLHLSLVGDGSELVNLKKLVNELELQDLVTFTGYLTGEALDNLFDSSHIAIASLGQHRSYETEASDLKVREYCARGIPFIYGCSDGDFPNDFPYILYLPADESPIDIELILNFAERVCSKPDHITKMREYAREKLDWPIKMKLLEIFCESLVK